MLGAEDTEQSMEGECRVFWAGCNSYINRMAKEDFTEMLTAEQRFGRAESQAHISESKVLAWSQDLVWYVQEMRLKQNEQRREEQETSWGRQGEAFQSWHRCGLLAGMRHMAMGNFLAETILSQNQLVCCDTNRVCVRTRVCVRACACMCIFSRRQGLERVQLEVTVIVQHRVGRDIVQSGCRNTRWKTSSCRCSLEIGMAGFAEKSDVGWGELEKFIFSGFSLLSRKLPGWRCSSSYLTHIVCKHSLLVYIATALHQSPELLKLKRTIKGDPGSFVEILWKWQVS